MQHSLDAFRSAILNNLEGGRRVHAKARLLKSGVSKRYPLSMENALVLISHPCIVSFRGRDVIDRSAMDIWNLIDWYCNEGKPVLPDRRIDSFEVLRQFFARQGKILTPQAREFSALNRGDDEERNLTPIQLASFLSRMTQLKSTSGFKLPWLAQVLLHGCRLQS